MNSIIYISGLTDTLQSTTTLPQCVFKGETEITIDFSNIAEGLKKVLQIDVNFGDGNTYTAQYTSTILTDTVKHTYYPSVSTYLLYTHCSIRLTYNDFTTVSFIVSIVIAQPSFLSEYESLIIKNAQFIDNSNTSDMIVVLESGKHNIYNVRLSAKTLNTGEAAPLPSADKLITEQGDSIVTDLYNNIKITT